MLAQYAYQYAFLLLMSLTMFGVASRISLAPAHGVGRVLKTDPFAGIKNVWTAIGVIALIAVSFLTILTTLWMLQRFFGSFLTTLIMVTNSIAAIGFVLAFAVPLERRFDTRLITIVSVLIGLAMSGACYIWPSWITYNLLAIAIGSLIGNVYTVTKMRYLVCGLIGIALYDAGVRDTHDARYGVRPRLIQARNGRAHTARSLHTLTAGLCQHDRYSRTRRYCFLLLRSLTCSTVSPPLVGDRWVRDWPHARTIRNIHVCASNARNDLLVSSFTLQHIPRRLVPRHTAALVKRITAPACRSCFLCEA
jgi:hypothetical protein